MKLKMGQVRKIDSNLGGRLKRFIQLLIALQKTVAPNRSDLKKGWSRGRRIRRLVKSLGVRSLLITRKSGGGGKGGPKRGRGKERHATRLRR